MQHLAFKYILFILDERGVWFQTNYLALQLYMFIILILTQSW